MSYDHNNVVKTVFLIMYCYSFLGCDVCGEKACNPDSNVLNSCDGRSVTRYSIYVDFGEIEYQCSCFFKPNSTEKTFYILSQYPRYDSCGTAIQITEDNGTTYRTKCSKSTPGTVISTQSTSVKLFNDNIPYRGDTQYCVIVYSETVTISGFCQKTSTALSSTSMELRSTSKQIIFSLSKQHGTDPTSNVEYTTTPVVDLSYSSSRSTQSLSTPINKSSIIDEFELTIADDFLIIMVSGIIGTALISIAIIIKVKRRNVKMSQSTKKVTETTYQEREDNELQNVNIDIPLSISTFKTISGSSNANQSDENRGSGYWMVENSFYLSADEVAIDNDGCHQNVLDIDPAVYSEIRDSRMNEDYQRTAFEYDYAILRDSH